MLSLSIPHWNILGDQEITTKTMPFIWILQMTF